MAKERRTSVGFYYWSPTGLDLFLGCPRQWQLSRQYPLSSGVMALGIFMHRRVADLRLAVVKKRRYKSAESWAKACAATWTRYYCQKEPRQPTQIKGQETVWKDEDEKWILRNRIKKICRQHFERLMAEPPPIVFYSKDRKPKISYSFEFEINGLGFSGEIDEILPGMMVRDYKAGKWGYLLRKLEFVFQPTFYLLAFCSAAHQKESFCQVTGVDPKIAKSWGGQPIFISPEVKFQYYMLEEDFRKEKEQLPAGSIIPATSQEAQRLARTDLDFKKLCQQIEEANCRRLMMEELKIFPAGQNPPCFKCLVKDKCEEASGRYFTEEVQLRILERKKEVKLMAGDYEQLMLPFVPIHQRRRQKDEE